MTTPVYPLDLTGLAASNLVENELHTLTEINDDTYRILIPTFAPFYLHNLLVEHVDVMGVASPMEEGADYYCSLPYMAATRSTGKPVYGGLCITNRLVEGTIRLRYQTVGGEWCADVDYVYERLLESVYNRRTTWWDRLTNVQEIFPPTEHPHPVTDIEGHGALLLRLQAIEEAILARPNDIPAMMAAHILDYDLHHQTATSVGLGKVANLEMATDEEVMTLQPLEKYVTLRQALMLLSLRP